MQSLQIGWIDHSGEDRNKILSVLSLLSIPEAVDELGIGVVRDGFADLMFPGTSTVQTRAKYFFIIPYLLMELERDQNLTPAKLLERLSKEELSLIQILKKTDADGVIGARAGEDLQRKPSSIYWNGLYTYDILHSGTRLSLSAYAKAACNRIAEVKRLSAVGHNDKGEGTDDSAALRSGSGGFWRSLPPPNNWRDSISIGLTASEAAFLREKIINSPHSKNSLFAHLLSINFYHAISLDEISDLGEALDLPEELRMDFDMAERFADFIYGANIRYNMILSKGQSDRANSEWDKWYGRAMEHGTVFNYDIFEVFNRLPISQRNRVRLFPFMKNWRIAVLSGDIAEMDRIVINREIELKRKERSKLWENNNFQWREEHWIGGGRLQYRFRIARRFIDDIFKGLGEPHHA